MANFFETIMVAVLIVIDGHFTNGSEEVETSDEELKVPGSERFPRHDQNRDGAASHDEPIPFVNENPGNYFMDLYSIQTGPKQVEFGHVYENPDTWEQRYEKKDHENKRFQGQVWNVTQRVFKEGNYDVGYRRGNDHHVKEYREISNPKTGHFKIMARWGDKNGGYGEQYWDYNHGGPEDNEGYLEDRKEESSLSVRSPSIDTSPSTYNSVSQTAKPMRATPTTTAYSKPKKAKKNQKRYEEPPRKRTTKIPESSNTDENYFVLPRRGNPTSAEETTLHQTDPDSGPLRFHLYAQPKSSPTAHKQVLEITPSTPRSYSRTVRP